jgi:hypothetical protein
MAPAEEKRLSLIDRYLTLIIFIAMAVGIGIGYLAPSVTKFIAGLHGWAAPVLLAVGPIMILVLEQNEDKLGKEAYDGSALCTHCQTNQGTDIF